MEEQEITQIILNFISTDYGRGFIDGIKSIAEVLTQKIPEHKTDCSGKEN